MNCRSFSQILAREEKATAITIIVINIIVVDDNVVSVVHDRLGAHQSRVSSFHCCSLSVLDIEKEEEEEEEEDCLP